MRTPKNVVWLVKGKITDKKEFDKVTKQLAKSASLEYGNQLYWCALNPKGEFYFGLCGFKTSENGLQHLSNWNSFAGTFKECATIDTMTVYGDPSDQLRMTLSASSPMFMNFYGGFWKEDKSFSDKNIIWMFDGEVTDEQNFKKAMQVLTENTYKENGSLSHWWTKSVDGMKFNVIERYANEDAAFAHLSTWMKFGALFIESTQISEYKIFSNISDKLLKRISGLDPDYLSFSMGFTK